MNRIYKITEEICASVQLLNPRVKKFRIKSLLKSYESQESQNVIENDAAHFMFFGMFYYI